MSLMKKRKNLARARAIITRLATYKTEWQERNQTGITATEPQTETAEEGKLKIPPPFPRRGNAPTQEHKRCPYCTEKTIEDYSNSKRPFTSMNIHMAACKKRLKRELQTN